MSNGYEGDPEYEALLEQERSKRGRIAPPSATELAHKVHALGGYVVALAWIVGALAVLSSLGLILDSGGAGFLFGVLGAAIGVGSAAAIALAGRYAQMRAAVVLTDAQR